MAGIEKLYLHDYGDLADLRMWATVFYPELLLYFYDSSITADYAYWTEQLANEAKRYKEQVRKTWANISSDGTIECAIAELIRRGYSQEDAANEAKLMYKDYKKTTREIYSEVKFAVMHTPFKIDKKLAWICPVRCVRKYLEDNCGIKTRWYHKIFWRGKKHFDY